MFLDELAENFTFDNRYLILFISKKKFNMYF